MSKSLIIAEKPSVASDLARALGKFKREKDFFENDQYVISSAVGHLVEMVPPEGAEVKRGKWNLENLPVLPDHFDLSPIEKNKARQAIMDSSPNAAGPFPSLTAAGSEHVRSHGESCEQTIAA